MKNRRGWRTLLLGLLLLLGGYPVFAAASAGHSWRQSDWNGDGRTTLGEWFYGMDVITLNVVIDGRACTEYLDAKSGNLVRVHCPSSG